jgi:hypothetical protein
MTNFHDLPGELRNRIYEAVLPVGQKYRELYSSDQKFHARPPAICRVSPQIHNDTMGLWRARNALSIVIQQKRLSIAGKWLQELKFSGIKDAGVLFLGHELKRQVNGDFVMFTVRVEGDRYTVRARKVNCIGTSTFTDFAARSLLLAEAKRDLVEEAVKVIDGLFDRELVEEW